MSEVLELAQALIAIESVNPDLVAGAAGETQIAGFIKTWLETRGFDVTILEPAPNRPTVVGVLRGSGKTGGGKTLMLNGHTDTVALQPFDGDPLEPRVLGGKLYGRGSYDMKAGVAAMMTAAARVSNAGLRGDVIVACVCDEEVASLGSFDLVKHFTVDAAIVTEPTDHALYIAHKGFVWADVTVHGSAAHGSRFDLGRDAVLLMGAVLTGVRQLDLELRSRALHPLLGHGSLHGGTIHGGQGYSSYPHSCTVTLERRTIPGETPQTVEAELRALLKGIKTADPDFEYTLEIGLTRQPFEIDPAHGFVKLIRRHASSQLGEDVPLRGVGFWADTAALSQAGIPALMFGCLGAGAHAAEEWVSVDSVERCTDVYEAIIREFCA
jgi:acetylornithine deacetylase